MRAVEAARSVRVIADSMTIQGGRAYHNPSSFVY